MIVLQNGQGLEKLWSFCEGNISKYLTCTLYSAGSFACAKSLQPIHMIDSQLQIKVNHTFALLSQLVDSLL